MPNISEVTDISSFLLFLSNFIESILSSIKVLWNFIITLFNPSYYTDIFEFLPSPFDSILLSFIGFLVVLLLLKLVGLIRDAIA